MNMPSLIYGTAWKEDRTADLVVQAVKAGFRGVDTACQPKHYNEPLVGEALVRLAQEGVERSAIFLQTKFTPIRGQDPNRVPYDKQAPIDHQVLQSFETSKTNLHTDYIDSLVLHSPMAFRDRRLRAWGAMESLHTAGAVGQLGISNCYDLNTLKDLYQHSSVKPKVLQNRFYRKSGYDSELRNWCNDNDVTYQSFWTLTANPHLLQHHTTLDLADKYSKTPEQILFRFLTQIGITVLTGTTSIQHMQEDLSIFEFELSETEVQNLNRLLMPIT